VSAPLSIAMLSHLASPHAPTGAERSLVVLANGLAAAGHRVFMTAPGPFVLESALAPGIKLTRIPCRMCWVTHFAPEPAWRVAGRWLRFAAPDAGEGAISHWLTDVWPDVVHVNCLPHVKGARAAHRAGHPVVWHIREILPPGARRRWFAKKLASYATSIVAVSAAVAQWLNDEGLGARVTVVPNGVDPPVSPRSRESARRFLGLPVDGVVAGLFGQVLPHKGVLEAIEAVAAARAAAPALRLVVAGDGPLDFLERVDAAASRLELGESFRRLPGLSDPSDLFAASDFVLLTTLTPDPLPRAVLEGMAWGRPVAAFRSGGAAEMIVDGRTGLLVDTGDVAALGAAMARLAQDAKLRETLGPAGRQRAKESFSTHAHVLRMEAILREAAKKR
jgi:glycosyltransferase involved in cell wall biosynthesis